MSSISLILGYGIFIAPNPNYQKYLDTALEKALETNPDYVFLTGGCTNSEYPELSEAQSFKNYFISIHPELESKILLSENSFTTPQNLENSLEILKSLKINCDNLSIVSDSIRTPKAFYLGLSLLFPDLTTKDKLKIFFDTFIISEINTTGPVQVSYENLQVSGIPLSDTMDMAASQVVSSMFDMHFIEYPDLQDMFITWRKTKWGVK